MKQDSCPSTQTISLTEKDYVELFFNGARIKKLVLGGITVIEAIQPYDNTGSGNYLMYPWVSRLEKPQPLYEPVFRDGNGYPIHGMVINLNESIKTQKVGQKIVITVRPSPLIPAEIPNFVQVFTLQKNKLTIHMKVLQPHKNNLPFCFGYHPYFQINNEEFSQITFETNLKTNVKLDQKLLLPIIPFVETEKSIVSGQKYDHLFKHDGKQQIYFRLHHKDGRCVQVASTDMRYWQIYTPSDGKRIAVQPMSFIGNIYTIYSEEKFGKLPEQGTLTISVKNH